MCPTDINGCIVSTKEGQSIVLPFKYIFAKEWSDNCIPVMCGNYWGVLDDSLNEIVSCSYDELFIFKGKAIAKKDSKYVIIDLGTKEVTEIHFDNVLPFNDDSLLVAKKTSVSTSSRRSFGREPKQVTKYGLIDSLGQTLAETLYDEITLASPDPEKDEDEDEEEDYGNRGYSYEDEPHTYEKYAGTYAQDVAGLSDEVIDEVFDGDPDLYWNID